MSHRHGVLLLPSNSVFRACSTGQLCKHTSGTWRRWEGLLPACIRLARLHKIGCLFTILYCLHFMSYYHDIVKPSSNQVIRHSRLNSLLASSTLLAVRSLASPFSAGMAKPWAPLHMACHMQRGPKRVASSELLMVPLWHCHMPSDSEGNQSTSRTKHSTVLYSLSQCHCTCVNFNVSNGCISGSGSRLPLRAHP